MHTWRSRKLLAQHRAFARLDDPARSYRRIASLDELLAVLRRFHAATVRWRDAQPPDELLQADLRNVLGASYATSGPYFTRRIRDRLPSATLRRS